MPDYYSTLGVAKTATQEDIKKAYRKLAHQHHPDKGGEEKKFKEINEAYQVLGNEEKRKQYDQYGRVFDGANGFGQQGPGFDFSSFWQPGQGAAFDFGSINLDDVFDNFFGGSRRAKSKNANRGKDLELTVAISLEETLKTSKPNIAFQRFQACSRCDGSGAEPGAKIKECFSCRGTGEVQQMHKTIFGTMNRIITCPECKGEGKTPEKPCNVCKSEGRIKGEQEIEIVIPAGIDNGQVLKIDEHGDIGKRKGPAGDLYVKIFINQHPVFQRKADDLLMNLAISFSQAALGGEVEIKTIDGSSVILKIPAGVGSGKIFRISGKGIPHFSGWGKGDLYVAIEVRTPKKLSKKQKDLLEQLRKEGL